MAKKEFTKITDTDRVKMKAKSFDTLPSKAGQLGWTPDDFRKAGTKPLFDNENSFFYFINRLVDEGNLGLNSVYEDMLLKNGGEGYNNKFNNAIFKGNINFEQSFATFNEGSFQTIYTENAELETGKVNGNFSVGKSLEVYEIKAINNNPLFEVKSPASFTSGATFSTLTVNGESVFPMPTSFTSATNKKYVDDKDTQIIGNASTDTKDNKTIEGTRKYAKDLNDTTNIQVKQNTNEISTSIYNATGNYNAENGEITLTFTKNNSEKFDVVINTPAEHIIDTNNPPHMEGNILVITFVDGSVVRVDMSQFVNIYYGSKTAQVNISIDDATNTISATLVDGGITLANMGAWFTTWKSNMDDEEATREANEEARASAETERISNENTRIVNENTRQDNEHGRVLNEVTREARSNYLFNKMQQVIDDEQQILEEAVDEIIDTADTQMKAYVDSQTSFIRYQLANIKSMIYGTTNIVEVLETYTDVDTMDVPTLVDNYIVLDNQYALINNVKGSSKVFNQLINPANYPADYTVSNVTFTKQSDGSLKVVVGEGGASGTALFSLVVKTSNNHIYLLKGTPSNGSSSSYFSLLQLVKGGNDVANILADYGTGYKTNLSSYDFDTIVYTIQIARGCPAGTYIFKPNLIDLTLCGDDNLTLSEAMAKYNNFYAYDSGSIKDVEYKGVQSVGYNKFSGTNWVFNKAINPDGSIANATKWSYCEDYVEVEENTTYKILFENVRTIRFAYYDKDKVFISRDTDGVGTPTTKTIPSGCKYIRVNAYLIDNKEPQKTLLTTDISATIDNYKPYIESGKLLEEAITLKGVNTAKDEVIITRNDDSDFFTMKRISRVGKVDLGKLNWIYNSRYGFNASISNMKSYSNSELPNILTPNYTTITWIAFYYTAIGTNVISATGTTVGINSTITDVATFKNTMNGVMLNYELATPTEEVLFDNLTADDVSFFMQKGGNIKVANDNSIYNAKVDLEIDFNIIYN